MHITEKISKSDLALKIENLVGSDNAKYVDVIKRICPQEEFGIFEFEGGVSCFAGMDSPFTNTFGFGLVDSDNIDRILQQIEEFYGRFSQVSKLSIADVCSERIQNLLSEKNYQLTASTCVFTRELSNLKPYNGEISVQLCQSPEQIHKWVQTLSEGFGGDIGAPDIMTLGQSKKVGNTFYLATLGGKVIAGCTLYIENKIARLGGMVTLKEYRNKGAQTALIAYRLSAAQRMGCTLATTETEAGSKSQSNLESAGFNFVYARNVFKK